MYLLKGRERHYMDASSTLGLFDNLDTARTALEDRRKALGPTVDKWDFYDILEYPRNTIGDPILIEQQEVLKRFPVELSTRHYTPGLKRDTDVPEEIWQWLYEESENGTNFEKYGSYKVVYTRTGRVYRISFIFETQFMALRFKLIWG